MQKYQDYDDNKFLFFNFLSTSGYASRVPGVGEGLVNGKSTFPLNCSFKKKKVSAKKSPVCHKVALFWPFLSRFDFSGEGGGALSQNS